MSLIDFSTKSAYVLKQCRGTGGSFANEVQPWQQLSNRWRLRLFLAPKEALINALKHGNGLDPKKKVRFLRRITPEDMQFQIIDEGPGFNPDDVPDPTLVENLERPCGRGLFMMRCFMDE